MADAGDLRTLLIRSMLRENQIEMVVVVQDDPISLEAVIEKRAYILSERYFQVLLETKEPDECTVSDAQWIHPRATMAPIMGQYFEVLEHALALDT